MSALEILGHAYVISVWAVVIYIVASIAKNRRPDPDEDPDAWDRAHDLWVDEQTGVL